MIRWHVYRLDADQRGPAAPGVYVVYSPSRAAAIRAARIERFGVVLALHMLGAARA